MRVAHSRDHNQMKFFVIWSILIMTWILHESEAFICKASEGDDVVPYFESSVTQHMEASGSPHG